MIVEGMELKVVSVVQEKPYTMVLVRHEYDGLKYEARGWSCWRHPDVWSEEEGKRIAILRAKRRIALRLRRERELPALIAEASDQLQRARDRHYTLDRVSVAYAITHVEGRTVRL